MFEIDGRTKNLAIFGFPVEHSFSPRMHNFISEKLSANYVYTAFSVRPDDLGTAVAALRAMSFSGVNITAPHKYAVMEYLDEVSPQAEKLGSVNTIVNNGGRLIGYNTDADGLYMAMKAEGVLPENKDILIFGAGGATKPISVLFAQRGAKSITILNRTKSKAEEISVYVKDVCGFDIGTERTLGRYDIVINTTSAGMAPQTDKCPTDDFSVMDSRTAVIDMIYNPDKTLFLKKAEIIGAKTMNGLGMLIYQGLLAYELFTGLKLPENMADLVKREVFGR